MTFATNTRGDTSTRLRVWSALGVLGLALPACGGGDTPDNPGTGGGDGGTHTAAGKGGSASGSGGSGATMNGGSGGSSAGKSSGGSGGQAAGTGGSNASGGAGAGAMGGSGPAGMGGTGGGGGGRGPMGGSDAGGMGPGGKAGGGGAGAGAGGGGGAGVLGPGLTDVSGLTPASCTITPMVTPASKIPTVGVATFTTDLAGATGAIIQFGKTTTYTLEAPVEWAAADHLTWLLGMPANTDVHYRVVVLAGSSACVGPDATYKTGALSGAPANQTPTKGSGTPAPGFIIAESGSSAYIVNREGEVVWSYKTPLMSLSRALMSWDGKYMYAREVGPFNASSGGSIYRVAMDGTGETKLPVTGGTHHDVVATPTGIAYPAKQTAGACDCIFTAGADGSNSKCLVDLDVVFGKFQEGPGSASMEKCHVNAIRYYKDTDSYSVSDREKDAIAFISAKGEVLGSVGATPTGTTPNHAKAEGADSTSSSIWRVQHGHDLYEPNKLVLWSNGSFQGGMSKVLHYTISGATASLDWQYSAAGNSPTFSDAQHLPNGNFLVTNSQSGAVHEIDASAKLVVSYPSLSKGYSQHRSTLYGPPPGR
ncbi:MAG TPA: hypothetical protein VNN72_13085 [Polyangiaceae bacterium]|nr:hypothetical protein [Polyangiaceae bacterium]